MKTVRLYTWIALLGILCAGCDISLRTQYHIVPSNHSEAPAVQAERVNARDLRLIRKALSQIAAEFDLIHVDAYSSPEIVTCFADMAESFPNALGLTLTLMAWTTEDTAVVDLSLFTSGCFKPGRYRRIENRILNDLQRHFGERVKRVGWKEMRPPP